MPPHTVTDGWEGRAVFVRASTPTRTRNAQLRRARPPETRPSAYIIVYSFRPKGTSWHHNRHLIHPHVAESMDEVKAVFALVGFDHLFRLCPELRDGQKWKVTAAFENARVWARQQRKHHDHAG
jgi:hypothetical protein